jgi:hypothetical protein
VPDRKKSDQRFDQLRQEFNKWVPALRDIAAFVAPTCGFFEGDLPNNGRAIDHKKVLDSTAERALGSLAAMMQSGLTSPSRPWFRLAVADTDEDESDEGRYWLDLCVKKMLFAFAKSNVYGALYAMYEECAGFGTAAFMLVEDFKTILRARFFTIGEYYLGVGADGRVTSFARRYPLTVAQVVQEFGIDNVSNGVSAMFRNNNLETWVMCRHLIEPNDERVPEKLGPKGMAYRSIYWEEGCADGRYLKIAGFEEFPVMAPRWKLTRSTDTNGRGPGWYVLGDTKMLQKQQRDKLIILAKMGNPPVQLDGSVQGNANTIPGGVTRTDSLTPDGGVRPAYEVDANLEQIEYSINETKNAIREGLYANLTMIMQDIDEAGGAKNKTAFEIAKRHEEKLLLLGPVLERLQSECLGPLIERAFNIMLRMGQLPPPPESLAGKDLRVEYISMLAQAQQIVGTTGIEQVSGFVGSIAAAKPETLDLIDADEAIRSYAGMVGIPQKIIRSKDAVAKLRQARDRAAQQQAQLAALEKTVAGAKVLSETKMGQNSALDSMLGTSAGAPQ